MNPRPIEIIGGGLAGLALGLALRRHGVPVTLHEAGSYPRHRVCGEFITGLEPETAARLGIEFALAGARRHLDVAWFVGPREASVRRLPRPAIGISRYRLDARLAEAFVAAGGELRCRSRCTTRADAEGRVFATGRRVAAPRWLGLKMHVRGLALARDLELHLGDQAYVGLCAIEGDAVNVCGLFRLRELARRGPALLRAYLHAAGLEQLAARLAAAAELPDSFCAVAGLAFDEAVPPAQRVQLGDACAVIPPFTGNGMAMALQSAAIALHPLLEYTRGGADWAEVREDIARGLRGQFRTRLASAAALHSFLLQPRRQWWVARLSRARLLPFRPLYAALH